MWQRPVCVQDVPRSRGTLVFHVQRARSESTTYISAGGLQDDRDVDLHQGQAPEPAGTIGAGSIGHRVGERESLDCSSLRRVRSIQVPVQLITMGVALVTLEGSGATPGQIASNPRLDRRLVEPQLCQCFLANRATASNSEHAHEKRIQRDCTG